MNGLIEVRFHRKTTVNCSKIPSVDWLVYSYTDGNQEGDTKMKILDYCCCPVNCRFGLECGGMFCSYVYCPYCCNGYQKNLQTKTITMMNT